MTTLTTTLITGGAGFIGSQLAARLLAEGESLVVLDNFDPYYDPAVKRANLTALFDIPDTRQRLTLVEGDVRDAACVDQVFRQHPIRHVIHLAAMSGVRYSAENGRLYADVNTGGAVTLLDAARRHRVEGFVMGSTSSVYGETARVPFVEDDAADHPLAPYPASKRAAELFAHSYHHLYGLNVTVLRFFNVYGPHGRPDMMPMRAMRALLTGEPIPVYHNGEFQRDWTYVDDIVDGILAARHTPLGYAILNLGCGAPLSLNAFLDIYERLIGKPAIRQNTPAPRTEPPITYCDNTRARQLLGFAPKVQIEEGLARTWAWFQAQKSIDARGDIK